MLSHEVLKDVREAVLNNSEPARAIGKISEWAECVPVLRMARGIGDKWNIKAGEHKEFIEIVTAIHNEIKALVEDEEYDTIGC